MTHSTKGIVHGNTIELRDALGLPDGEEVFVTIEAHAPQSPESKTAAGEAIKRAAGSWDDDPDGLDEYLKWNREQRKLGRQPLEP